MDSIANNRGRLNRKFQREAQIKDENVSSPKKKKVENSDEHVKNSNKTKQEQASKNNGSHAEDDEELSKAEERLTVPLKNISSFCRTILQLNEQGAIKISEKKACANLESLLKGTDIESSIKEMQPVIRGCLRSACTLNNLSLELMLQIVVNHVEEERAVTRHQQFPKTPQNVWWRWCQRFGHSPLSQVPKYIHAQYQDKDNQAVKEVEKEYFEEIQKYLHQLRAFLVSHEAEIFPAQTEYVEKKIAAIEKQLKPGSRKKTLSKKDELTRSKLTAFEFFKASKKDIYNDLTEDKRDEKLRKKFEKLDETQRQIFEAIASGMA